MYSVHPGQTESLTVGGDILCAGGTLHVNLGQKCRLKNPSGNNLVLLFILGKHQELSFCGKCNILDENLRSKNEDFV
jgi:hypothetical protein